MPIVIFLIGIAAAAASSSHAPMDHVFLRGLTSNKLTAATLPAREDSTWLFLPRAGAQRPWTVF